MNYWLMKSEPDVFSYDDLVKNKKEKWDGVRNYQARNNLRAMQKGDLALFYHSNIGKEVVGVMEIVKAAYPDPTTDDDRWVCVDVSPKKKLKNPVTLEKIKQTESLQEIPLIRHTRLSVMPVTKEEFDEIVRLGND
ncbi:MAG TPA: EVE domain-containing protein [Chitinophagales bacterium]|nr:EVE domain-containing protein [Chitinophagales bacterium]